MKIRSGRVGARRRRCTQSATWSGGVSSGTYRATMPSLPLRHVAPPSSVSHTPPAEMPTARRSGSPGHGTIECRQKPAGARLPLRSSRMLRRRAAAANWTLAHPPWLGEQHAGVSARIDHAVRLAGGDHPRSARAPRRRPRAARRRRTAPTRRRGRRHRRASARRTARSPRRARGPERGSRSAYSTGSPANARAVTANGDPGSPSSANRPFLVPTSSSVTRLRRSREARRSGRRRRPARAARCVRRSRTR